MAVLEEVVAEMFRQEQEAMEVERHLLADQGEADMAGSLSHPELAYGGEIVGEDFAYEEYEAIGDTQLGALVTHYDELDDPDDFDDFDDFDGLTIPYEETDEDDDDDDGDFSDVDPRFIDYGWDAECLRDIEDIDFEFVYALHTFVATVEGQANATKGDTMVLLDDSNSYWWLVRVVKDSSIGKCSATTHCPVGC